MSRREIMQRVLPSVGDLSPHITSGYGSTTRRPPSSTNPHRGVDFNYTGGQSGLNLMHPEVHSPVEGIMMNAGQGAFGRIAIRDANDFLHEILHTQSQNVAIGDQVQAGQLIGTMGNICWVKPKIPMTIRKSGTSAGAGCWGHHYSTPPMRWA